jgi:type IV pilus assembly protein PilC
MKIPAWVPLVPKVTFLDKLLFTKHLSIMIKSGIIISEALETLISQSKSKVFVRVISEVLADVENGQSLSRAMAKHPEVFEEFYVSLISVGEESGTLEENLEFLAEQLAKDYAIRKKVKGAMMYPTMIFVAITVMGSFISLFILPQLVDFFAAFQIDLPLPTKILLFIANVMKHYGILVIGGGGLLLSMFLYIIRTPKIKPIWHKILLKMPAIGKFFVSVNMARFSRNLGTMLKSGVPLIRSLETTANTLDNLTFKRALTIMQMEVKKGKPLARAMENLTYSLLNISFPLFPSLLVKMISVGEKTGKLEDVLLYMGEFFEDDIDDFSKNLTTILEPFLLITIGIVVGFVALAIISPIYQLTGSIH